MLILIFNLEAKNKDYGRCNRQRWFPANKLRKARGRSLGKFINEWHFYKSTLQIPYPYTHANAHFWINVVPEFEQQYGKRQNWSIRDQTGTLIGRLGLHYSYGMDVHKNELGYWLAQPYWNQGIMTRVIEGFTNYVGNGLQFIRLEATALNSMHPLQKFWRKWFWIGKSAITRMVNTSIAYYMRRSLNSKLIEKES